MPLPRPKILVVDNARYITGSLTSIINLASCLKKEYEFILVLPTGGDAGEYAKKAGFTVYTVPMLEISKSLKSLHYFPRLLKNTRRLLQIIKEEKIDILHVNDLYNMLGCMVKRRRPSFPVVYHARLLASSYIAKLYPYFVSMIKRYADKIICVSAAVEKDVHPSAKTTIVYDAVATHETVAPWNGLSDPEYAQILYLANYVNGKGQQYAIHAFREVLTVFPNIKLHFAGGANSDADLQFRQSLIDLARELKMENSIIFESRISDIEHRIKQADIMLNLSESESFSMVTLEAMTCGVPLVVSDCGGPAEITDNGRYADLVPNRDAAAAATAVIQMLQQPEATKDRAKHGQEFVRKKFDETVAAKQLAVIYESIIPNSKELDK